MYCLYKKVSIAVRDSSCLKTIACVEHIMELKNYIAHN